MGHFIRRPIVVSVRRDQGQQPAPVRGESAVHHFLARTYIPGRGPQVCASSPAALALELLFLPASLALKSGEQSQLFLGESVLGSLVVRVGKNDLGHRPCRAIRRLHLPPLIAVFEKYRVTGV